MKRPRANNLRKTTDQPHGLPIRSNGRDLKSIEPNGEADAPVRRSSRLKAPAVSSGKVSSKVGGRTRVWIYNKTAADGTLQPARDRRGQRSQSATSSTASVDMTSPTSQDGQMQVQADDWLRDVVRRCAKAHRFLSVYACAEAIREVDTLPVKVQTSAWALELVARAYYEMASYTIVSLNPSPRCSKLTCRPDGYTSAYSKLSHIGSSRSNTIQPSFGIYRMRPRSLLSRNRSCRSRGSRPKRGSRLETCFRFSASMMKRCDVSSGLRRLIQDARMPGHCVGTKPSRWRSMIGRLHSIGPRSGRMLGITMLGESAPRAAGSALTAIGTEWDKCMRRQARSGMQITIIVVLRKSIRPMLFC